METNNTEAIAYSPEIVQVRAVLAKHQNEWKNTMIVELADLLLKSKEETERKTREQVIEWLDREWGQVYPEVSEACQSYTNKFLSASHTEE